MPVNIVQIEDDGLPVDTHPKLDAALGRVLGLPAADLSLEFQGAPDAIQRGLEHRNVTITGILHDLAPMSDDRGIYDCHAQQPEPPVGVQFGRLHQPRVADDIRREDGARSSLELEH